MRINHSHALNRFGEQGHVPLRNKRFYQLDKAWYFCARQSLDHGPYTSLTEAKQALTIYIKHKLLSAA